MNRKSEIGGQTRGFSFASLDRLDSFNKRRRKQTYPRIIRALAKSA